MPGCCVPKCHNRAEKGYKLYKLPQGDKNDNRRKIWIQNINRKDLPQHAYVCQDHFTNDQFEMARADNKKLLKWNAIPTLFSHCKEQEKLPKQEIIVTVLDSNNKSEETIKENNLNVELKNETEVKMDSHTNSDSDEVATLKCELNFYRQEIRTLRTIISQLQTIIERMIEDDDFTELLSTEP